MKDIKVFEENNLKIISNENFTVVYDTETNRITLNSNIPVNIQSNQLSLDIEGEFNIQAKNLNIYTDNKISLLTGGNLYLNTPDSEQREIEENNDARSC